MAVGLEATQFSKTGRWNSALQTARIPRTSDSMTSIMSYQYPLPPASDVDVAPPNMMNNYHLPALAPPIHTQNLNKVSPIRKAPSGPLKTGKMKRSASSPNVRGQARADPPESAFISLADEKRRNKLGYHRTSVACGHCRRRKIRCIPAIGDSQNRCANCIRLKKECHFHPVDQGPEPTPGSRRDSQAQVAAGRTSSSSPINSGNQSSEAQSALPYPHLSIPPIQDVGGPVKKSQNDSFSSENKGNWVPNDVKGSSEAPYWRNNHESPVNPGFPYSATVQVQHPSHWSHTPTEPASREELAGWPAPQRSMSYSHHETLHHPPTYPNYHHSSTEHNAREEYTHRPPPPQPDLYAPALTPTNVSVPTSEAALSATSSETAPHPSGHSQLPPPYPNPQGWQPYAYKVPALPSNGEAFHGWYGQNSSLPTHSHGGEVMPPPAYGHVEPYGGMYYPNVTQGSR